MGPRADKARAIRVLIDASNLHVGGGIQVAASFLDELATLRGLPGYEWIDSARIEASPMVLQSMSVASLKNLPIRQVYRRPGDWKRWIPRPTEYDVSFVVFGPEYGARRAARRVVGFADVTSIYPPQGADQRTLRLKLRWVFRGWVSRQLTKRVDHHVVETHAMADRLQLKVGVPLASTSVVSNTYSAMFDEPERWGEPLDLVEKLLGEVRFAYVTRAYAHKNLDFLGLLADELQQLGVLARFLVTLEEGEWNQQTEAFRRAAVNAGHIPLCRVPRLYEACDAAVFPSLLEAFSAMPLEAMRMGLPVFASDRVFVRSVCRDGAAYFDPTDAASAAHAIAHALCDPAELGRMQRAGAELLAQLPNANTRARAYADVIMQQALRPIRSSS
jgi:glycosyltransferase involved in cell wall biosynthesis